MKEGRDESRRSQERGVEGRWGRETGDDEPLQRQREIKMEMRRHQRALRSPTRQVWKPGKGEGREEGGGEREAEFSSQVFNFNFNMTIYDKCMNTDPDADDLHLFYRNLHAKVDFFGQETRYHAAFQTTSEIRISFDLKAFQVQHFKIISRWHVCTQSNPQQHSHLALWMVWREPTPQYI